jgi:DNA polymerase III subunit alpha
MGTATRWIGLLVYQDDVLLTAINIAGYSWEEADKLRKAMGKTIPVEMAKQKIKFIDGCVKGGMSRRKRQSCSRSSNLLPCTVSAKRMPHRTAPLATKPLIWRLISRLNLWPRLWPPKSGDEDKIYAAVEECEAMGIAVLPPDVNESRGDFGLLPEIIAVRLTLNALAATDCTVGG